MIPWPTDLPVPLLDASGKPDHSIISSSLDSATVRRRLRFKGNFSVVLSISWAFTIQQYRDFKEFYATTIDNGASLFSIDLRYPETSELLAWVVRFQDSYNANYQEGLWSVAATFELLRPLVPPDAGSLVGYGAFLVLPDSNPFVDADGHTFHVHI